MFNKYNQEHGIDIRELPLEPEGAVLPILLSGHWDYLIQQYEPKEESLQYSTKKLFTPESNSFVPVDGDVDPREGVMSRFEHFLPRAHNPHVTTPSACLPTIEEVTEESG
jgi:hypothetical protein